MAITQTFPTSFKIELLNAIHAFGDSVVRGATTPDTFKLALYTSSAVLDETTTAYTPTGEVSNSGTNYPSGGLPLTTVPPTSTGTIAFLDFNDLTFSSVTFTARGCLIYNDTQADKAVAILDFGSDKSATSGDFSIIFPTANSLNAIIRVA